MAGVKHWIVAARLRTLPLALSSIGMGSFLAAAHGYFDVAIFAAGCLTTVFLQILSNFANDYGDTQHGADSTDRQGPLRTVQIGVITKSQMRKAIMLFALLSLVSGVALILLAFKSLNLTFWIFFAMGLLAIGAAIKYTAGKNPYGYAGLGDISVLIFFGYLAVLGTYYLFSGLIDLFLLLPATASGLLATGVLNINNIRDMESDRKAGKYSIPVRIGRKLARLYHAGLVLGAIACAALYVFVNYTHIMQFLFIAAVPLLLINVRNVLVRSTPEEIDPLLKQLALSTLLFTILFGVGQLF